MRIALDCGAVFREKRSLTLGGRAIQYEVVTAMQLVAVARKTGCSKMWRRL